MVCMYVCMYKPNATKFNQVLYTDKGQQQQKVQIWASFERWVGFHLVTWPGSGITHISFTKQVPKGHPFNLLQVKVSCPNISCIKECQEHQLELSSNPTVGFFFILNAIKWANLDCIWCDTREHMPIYRFDIESNR